MTFRHVTAALAIAAVAGVLLARVADTAVAVLAAVACYLAVRWGLTTYARSTRLVARSGRQTSTCPDCGQYIRRVRGDWILTCRRCGWRAGWPGVRWLTRSVPARQLRRTTSFEDVAFVFFVVLVVVPVVGAIATATLPVTIDAFESVDAADIDDPEVERLVLEEINERRAVRGYPPLEYNDRAAQAARSHAEDMAANDYYSHTARDGETALERYRFCNGGENIAVSWVDREFRANYGTVRHTSAEEIADGLVTQWMNSTGHRENILRDRWSAAGVGVAITDDGKVYAVNALCAPDEGP